MTSRLTHLILAHNKLAGFSQIITAISVSYFKTNFLFVLITFYIKAHCPNLQLLDLSNIKTHAYNGSLLQVEKLQEGCPKIRVLRVTNSQILLAPTSLSDQVCYFNICFRVYIKYNFTHYIIFNFASKTEKFVGKECIAYRQFTLYKWVFYLNLKFIFMKHLCPPSRGKSYNKIGGF